MFPKRNILIATHPRSGTHLTIDFFRKQFRECKAQLNFGETRHHSYLTLEHLSSVCKPHISQNKAIKILNKSELPLIKTHCLPDFKELGSENKEFISTLLKESELYYVVRDGRKVMCSTHLWKQGIDPTARCSFSEFIRQEYDGMSYPKRWANHVHSWMKQANINIIKYEEIISQPREVLSSISQKIELKSLFIEPILPKKLAPINRWQDYWLRISRQFESTAIDNKYSKNKEPWQNLFTKEDRLFFHQEAGDILLNLEYEKNEFWVDY